MKTTITKHVAMLIVLLSALFAANAKADSKTVLWQDYSPNGASFSKTMDFDISRQTITAKIDLSSCSSSTTYENILSIGTAISEWGQDGAYNIHLFYTKSSSSLQVDYLNGNTNSVRKDISGVSGDITVVLSKDGLSVNGTTYATATDMSGLFEETSVQIGSTQGNTRSNATYNEVSVTTATVAPTFVAPAMGSAYYICPATESDADLKAFTVSTTENDEYITLAALNKSNEGQKWNVMASKSTEYNYHFKNVLSDLALDMAGNNTSVPPLQWTSEYDYNGGASANVNQEWKLVSAGTGNTYYCLLYTSDAADE